MKNQHIPAIIISLAIGLCLGYAVWGGARTAPNASMHQMPDGSMMTNGDHMGMGDMMEGMMAGLKGKTGDAFDKAFLDEMIVHHQGAVEMARAVLAQSKRPELIELAGDIISAQDKEIQMMQEWQKAWFR